MINPRGQKISTVTLWLMLGLVGLAIAARITPGPRTIDDSYITYRYARNILAGNGFVYNPGERVLGTTTPLYTFLMTGLAAISGGVNAPFPQISWIVNSVFDALTCLLLVGIGKSLKSPLAGTGAALVWAIAPFSVTFSIGGLETSLYVMLLTGAMACHLRSRTTWTAILCALAFLTRPDAVLLIGPLAFDRAWSVFIRTRSRDRSEKLPIAGWLTEGLALGLPVLAWLVFAGFYFGSPIPHSIAAKSVAYQLPPEAGLVRLLQHYATPFLEHLTFGTSAIAIGLFLYPFLFAIGARKALSVTRSSWPMLLYPWLYFAVFAAANPLIFRWYLTPPLPAYFLTILIGAEQITSQFNTALKAETDDRAALSRRLTAAVQIAILILLPCWLSLRDWTLRPDHGLNRPAPSMAWYQLELLYREAAEALTPRLQAADLPPVLAAGDVGVLGFYTGAKILDTVGLNSPISSEYYPLDPSLYVINYAIAPDLIADLKPDFLVILEVYGRAGLLKDPRFQSGYTLAQKIPSDIYGSDGMLIFEREK